MLLLARRFGLESWNGHRGVASCSNYGGRIFKQSAEQLSHVTERERLEAVRESQDPGRDMDRVFGEPELPQQSSQTSEHEPNVAPVPEQPDVSMPGPESPENTRRHC